MNGPLLFRPNEFVGKLITFCGLDGCGKSTMIKMLSDDLAQEGYEVLVTKQPTDMMRKTDIFRTFMDNPDHSNYEYRSLSLMAAADRIQHVNHVILPALKAGKIVICDRYFFSCLANLRARGYTDDSWIYDVSRSIIKPDLAFFLDVTPSVALMRVRSRPEEKDRFVDVDLQYQLHDEYRDIAMLNHGILLSSDDKPENTYENIISLVRGKLK